MAGSSFTATLSEPQKPSYSRYVLSARLTSMTLSMGRSQRSDALYDMGNISQYRKSEAMSDDSYNPSSVVHGHLHSVQARRRNS
ncbi:hypothetical protein SUGI_0688740 [Cryptomeria japonica]|nr:hypothetical protein SUGI_0688740 [Cryptomeria japonica]